MSPAQLGTSRPGIAGLIGHTPLVELSRHAAVRPGVRLLAKLEGRNPGGSVKDRPAWGIVQDALSRGRLGRGQTLLDATSGNTGIAYAMLGAALGFPVRLCLPANASPERQQILLAYGATLERTDPLEGTDGAIRRARAIAEREGERVFYADQYANPANWRAHYEGTAVELLRQTDRAITHFVAGLGTTGTLIGTGRRLRDELGDGVTIVAVQPDGPFHGIEGLKHLESAIVPEIYDATVPDRHRTVSTEEAQAAALRLAREEGLFAGVSSGAAYLAAREIAEEIEQGVVVALFPDGGERYLGERFWADALSNGAGNGERA